MPKQPVPAAGTTRSKRTPSNVVRFPKKRGRPRGSTVDPIMQMVRQTGNPDFMIALMARRIIDEHKARGQHLDREQAIDMALCEFQRRFGGLRKLTVRRDPCDPSGQRFLLKGAPAKPNRGRILELLRKGRVKPNEWRQHVAAVQINLVSE